MRFGWVDAAVRPEWLRVPAADASSGRRGRACKRSRARSAIGSPPGGRGVLPGGWPLDAERQGAWAMSGVDRAHFIVFVGDPDVATPTSGTAADVSVGCGETPLCESGLAGLPPSADLVIEVLGPGTLGRTGSGHGVRGAGAATARAGGHRVPLDKHGLDVALSVGRHAAERAKLADSGLLIAVGRRACVDEAMRRPNDAWPRWCKGQPEGSLASRVSPSSGAVGRAIELEAAHAGADPDTSPVSDPYEAVRHAGDFELAALVGTAIAGAQMALPVLLLGDSGRRAAAAAARLHPGLRGWLWLTGPSDLTQPARAEPGAASCGLQRPRSNLRLRPSRCRTPDST